VQDKKTPGEERAIALTPSEDFTLFCTSYQIAPGTIATTSVR
jgi:hypothetical protein